MNKGNKKCSYISYKGIDLNIKAFKAFKCHSFNQISDVCTVRTQKRFENFFIFLIAERLLVNFISKKFNNNKHFKDYGETEIYVE